MITSKIWLRVLL